MIHHMHGTHMRTAESAYGQGFFIRSISVLVVPFMHLFCVSYMSTEATGLDTAALTSLVPV